MPRVIQVKDSEEFAQHVNTKSSFGLTKGVVVDFTATWCGPCKMFAPIFDKLSDQYPSLTFLKVDVDEVQEVAQACGIKAMPTCQTFSNGQKQDEVVGLDPKKIQDMLTKLQGMVSQSAGAGRKLGEAGGSGSAAEGAGVSAGAGAGGGDDDMAARRARMAAAAEARMKAAGGQS